MSRHATCSAAPCRLHVFLLRCRHRHPCVRCVCVCVWGLGSWFRYLSEPPKEDAAKDKFPGPRTILEYWRGRMTRLTSITEQMKTKDCKAIISILSAVSKSDRTDEASRQGTVALLRRWKQVDVSITEGANEAKDNVKYLSTLEKFVDPLYVGDPVSIVDTLPALLNSLKMIHTIAR